MFLIKKIGNFTQIFNKTILQANLMSNYYHKLLKKNPFILAPMDDVTDIAFREICEDAGASYSTTELTSVDALIRDKVPLSRYQRGNLKRNQVQLFGCDPDTFVKAAKYVNSEADSIDVNFGCPSGTVTGNNSGAMLLKDPKNVGQIIEKLVKNVDKPISAKIRLGYKKTTYSEVAKEIEDAGAELLAVHGRTAEQKYSGKANWDAIKEIYQKVEIPLVGNGDIRNEEDIDSYLNKYSDALMIGRAAIGNPMIFKQFNHYYNQKEKLEFDRKIIQKKLFVEYINKLGKYEFRNENIKIQRQGMWFMKGIEGAKELRKDLVQMKERDKIIQRVNEF